jgi:uncharacterized protein (TIGR00156 family)
MKNKRVLAGLAALVLVFGVTELRAGDGHHDWWWWNYGPGSGASGAVPNFPVSTIAQAKGLPDNAPVAIEGKIIRPLGKELFEISDGRDTVTVEIDDHHWYAFRPEDTIIIYGEVDRHGFRYIIEAHSVVKK